MKKILMLFALAIPFVLSAQTSVQQSTVGFLSYNEGRVLALAEKFSAEQYDWRPAEGVRSVGEVLMHIVQANYMFMSAAGVAPPAGVNPQTIASETTGKQQIIDAVKASYVVLKDGITGIPDDHLGDEVQLPFPGEYNKLAVILLCLDHTSEHLGQLIAYARMNGVTPPWSEGGDK